MMLAGSMRKGKSTEQEGNDTINFVFHLLALAVLLPCRHSAGVVMMMWVRVLSVSLCLSRNRGTPISAGAGAGEFERTGNFRGRGTRLRNFYKYAPIILKKHKTPKFLVHFETISNGH